LRIDAPPDKAKGFLEELSQRIQNPTRPRSVLSLYEWTMRYRRFDGRPPSISWPLHDIYHDMHPNIVIMKAAQVGISEWGINMGLWVCDQNWADRGVSLYVFPKQDQVDDFSQDRVMRAIRGSDYLRSRINHIDSSGANTNRTRLRKIGGRPIYFRGSDSIAQTRSIDADLVIADEVDLFKPGAVERIKERLGSSAAPLFRAFSQPLYPNGPIDMLFRESDQRYYYLKCEHCGLIQKLEWEHNVIFNMPVTDVQVVCRKCRRPIDRLGKGEWVAEHEGAYVHGYHLSKLYSPNANLIEMALKSMAINDPERYQSFYNADLGVPYRPAGTPGLDEFTKDSYPWQEPLQENYLGCDVGTMLHVTVYGRDSIHQPLRLLYCAEIDKFEKLEEIWRTFNPRLGVIDGQGDPRATIEWASKHPGRVYRWFHRPGALQAKFLPESEYQVHYHRTALLDNLYGLLRSKSPVKVILHSLAPPDFWKHHENNIREIIKDSQGKMVPHYASVGPDHYAFASAFALLASGLRPSSSQGFVIPKAEFDVLEPLASVGKAVTISDEGTEATIRWSGTGSGGRWNRWRP